MSRVNTLPSGVATAAGADNYRACHAVVVLTPSPLRWCDGPKALTIGGEVYQPGAITPSSVSLVGLPAIRVRVPNTANEISQPDADGTLVKAPLRVYEIHWSAAGAQLSELPLFDGEVVSTDCHVLSADIGAKARAAGTAGMVGRLVRRLCSYGFRDARCGSLGAQPATFARTTLAYKQNGSVVAPGAPRYEVAKYANGITVEEGTTNLLTANQSSVETDTTGFSNDGSSTITRDSTYARNGTYSLKTVAPGSAGYERFSLLTARPAATAATMYTASAWVRVASGTKDLNLFMRWFDAGGDQIGATLMLPITVTDTFQRFALTATAPANTATMDMGVLTGATPFAATWWTDCLQIEARTYATTWHIGVGGGAGSEGPKYPGTVTTEAYGICDWADKDKVKISDDDGAVVTGVFIFGDTNSYYLDCTGPGFAIPGDAVIDGILVETRMRGLPSGGIWARDDVCLIIKGGVPGSINKAPGTNLTNNWETRARGGAADKWGLSWTPADINAGNFGVRQAVYLHSLSGLDAQAFFDFVRVTVYFTAPSGGNVRSAESLTIPKTEVSDPAGTFEAWVKLLRAPGTNQQYVLDANGAANKSLKLYVRTDGKLECVFGTGAAETTITGTNTLAVDTLYHVAVTWSAAGVTVYRNGSSEGISGTAPSLAAGALVYLGSKADGTLQLDGILDDVRIEDNARSGTEIAADYASATALPLTSHTLAKFALDSDLMGAGSTGTCDGRLETCTALGNQLRFGGWPSMPQVGQKWSYTVTSPQPLSDRSGTLAPAPAPVQPPPVATSEFPRLVLRRT